MYFFVPGSINPASPAVVKEVRIILPESLEGVPGRFGVRGYGKGFENEGYIRVITASREEVILEDVVYFNAEGIGRSGPFSYTVDLGTIGAVAKLSGKHIVLEVANSIFPAPDNKKDRVILTVR